MRFPRTPTGSRSTVLDRLDALRASRAASEEDTEFLEQIIFTGRPVVVSEETQPPQKVKAEPVDAGKKLRNAPSAPQLHVGDNQPAPSRLSPFETELLEAWSQD